MCHAVVITYADASKCSETLKDSTNLNPIIFQTRIFCIETKEGWYQRFENNGWRLVSDRVMISMSSLESIKSVSSLESSDCLHQNQVIVFTRIK